MAGSSARAEIVFDNTQAYRNELVRIPVEMGDEIELAATNVIVSGIQIDYYAAFIPTGAQKARVRLYLNNGPGVSPKPAVYISPGTKLYESPLLPIAPGYNAISLTNIAAHVPTNKLTWTIEFSGFTTTNDYAGVLAYNPANVGFSHDDYWKRTATNKWGLFFFRTGPVSNFACRLFTDEVTPLELLSVTPQVGGNLLKLSGPLNRSCLVEVSSDLFTWEPVESFTFQVERREVLDKSALTNLLRFYRTTLLTNTLMEFTSITRQADGSRLLRFVGELNQRYRVESTADFSIWFPESSSVMGAGSAFYVDNRFAFFGRRFYRLAKMADPSIRFNQTTVQNGHILNTLSGAHGRDCVIYASDDLVEWEPISTNTFSFTRGTTTLLEALPPQTGARYYRAEQAW